MIEEDIKKDMTKAADAEAKALKMYNQMTGIMGQEKQDHQDLDVKLTGTQGEKTTKLEETKGARRLKKGELDIVLKKIEGAEAGCTYFTVNFPARTKNRQIEVDGLLKAKAILEKAKFATPKDETREMKPGDALLQRARRHAQ